MSKPLATTAIALSLFLVGAPTALADPNEDAASCMGLGSSFYAHMAPGQRADVQHLVQEFFADVPGEYLRDFAQEKEGGSIPEPCGTRIE